MPSVNYGLCWLESKCVVGCGIVALLVLCAFFFLLMTFLLFMSVNEYRWAQAIYFCDVLKRHYGRCPIQTEID